MAELDKANLFSGEMHFERLFGLKCAHDLLMEMTLMGSDTDAVLDKEAIILCEHRPSMNSSHDQMPV